MKLKRKTYGQIAILSLILSIAIPFAVLFWSRDIYNCADNNGSFAAACPALQHASLKIQIGEYVQYALLIVFATAISMYIFLRMKGRSQ